MTGKLNCDVQSCFELFFDKYLKPQELKNFLAFRFLWFTLCKFVTRPFQSISDQCLWDQKQGHFRHDSCSYIAGVSG